MDKSSVIAVALEKRAGGLVARVTLNNPKKLNSLDRAALAALVEEMRSVERHAELRAVVLTGAGDKAFAGGANLDDLAGLDPLSAREFIGLVHDACAAMRDCPVPVIARVNGYCLGAGLEIAAACDLRVAAEGTKFAMPEVRIGIPSVVEAALLLRLMGSGRAAWLVLTGEPIDARKALEWGLVEEIGDGAALLAKLLAGEREALRVQKQLLQLWEEAPLSGSVAASIERFAQIHR